MNLTFLSDAGLAEIGIFFWTIAGCALWLYVGISSFLALRKLDELADVDLTQTLANSVRETNREDSPKITSASLAEAGDFPRLSIIVPACNEAETLRAAQLSLLQQDYPDFEIILVNDRSTDSTGEIVEGMAARDARIRALHIDSLPDGWLGKVHAMQRAAEVAAGEILLFTDADIVFEADALRRAVRYMRLHRLDHLAALPALHTGSFWLKLLSNAFGVHFMAGMHKQADPDSREAIGVGAFNMVRRDVFHEHGGFERLRLEVADDVGLAKYLAENGARSSIIAAQKHISVEWYASVGDMIRGFEKNLFAAVAGFSFWRSALFTVLIVFYALAPFAGLLANSSWALLPGLIVGGILVAGIVIARRHISGVGFEGLFMPVGLLLLAVALANSAWQAWRRGGIAWRGTLYSIAELRRHQYVRLFK